jgi:two-component sensor histidine kinase
VSNALKYAFPQERQGHIRVELRRAAQNMYRLMIRDDGIGMPVKRRENSLGLKLVDMFAKQIGGSALIKNEAGTVVTVTFPG